MMHPSSPGTASETWAQTGAARTGIKPDGDWSCRANCGFDLAFWLIDDRVLDYAAVRHGRFTKGLSFEGFNVTNAVSDLSAKFEKHRPARFCSPALQRRFTDLPND